MKASIMGLAANAFQNLTRIINSPIVLALESTSACNARCYMCERPKLARKQTVMDFGFFKKAVMDAKKAGIKFFQLSFYGECLLDPMLASKIRLTKSEIDCPWIQIVTNGSLLTPEKSRELLESGISLIRISIDGNNDKEYEEIRPQLSYGTLLENIRALRDLRNSNPDYKTVIEVAGLNLSRFPLDEAAFKGFWLEYADRVFVRDEHILVFDKSESFLQKVAPCHNLLTMLTVFSDGRHTICPYDWYGEAVCGDMNNESLREAWFSRRRVLYKMLHAVGLKKTIPICRNCTYRPPVRSYFRKFFLQGHS